MDTKKAPTETGQGWKRGVDNLFSTILRAIVKSLFIAAAVGQTGGAR